MYAHAWSAIPYRHVAICMYIYILLLIYMSIYITFSRLAGLWSMSMKDNTQAVWRKTGNLTNCWTTRPSWRAFEISSCNQSWAGRWSLHHWLIYDFGRKRQSRCRTATVLEQGGEWQLRRFLERSTRESRLRLVQGTLDVARNSPSRWTRCIV